MQATPSLFARFGQGVNRACERLQQAGTQCAASVAHQVERALASCRRAARQQRPVGPAPHEVAPPLRQRQVDVLAMPLAGDRADAQRLQRLQRYVMDTEVAMANDPGQAERHVIAGIHLILVDAGVRGLDDAEEPGLPLPGRMDDAPAANDTGRY